MAVGGLEKKAADRVSEPAAAPPPIVRAYRTELDPTIEQRRLLARAAGAARWSYNWALARWREQYAEHKAGTRDKAPSWMSLHKELTQVKRQPETDWLAEVSAYVVREALADLGDAYKSFFRRLKEGKRRRAAGEPQFRSRLDRAGRGFRVAQPSAVDATRTAVKIAGVGWVKLREHGYLPVGANYRGLSAREVAGRWYVAIQVELPPTTVAPLEAGKRIGVEVGVRHLAVTSSDFHCGAMRDRKTTVRDERRLALWSRRMSRRHIRGVKSRDQSQGWHKALAKTKTIHARIADVRRDLLHQATTRIVRHERAEALVVRDAQVSQMIGRAGKSGAEARARNAIAPMVAKVGMFELRRQLEYKQKWRGGSVEVVPNDSPTTRTCSGCGVVRETDPGYPGWRCADCGVRHDRELNSARNLRDFAGGSSPGGSGGRAVRRKAPKGVQRPREPDTSTAGVSSTPPAAPDGGSAVSAALASLGPGNRAAGEQSPVGTDGGNADPTGGVVSTPTLSTFAPIAIERRGDAHRAKAKNQGVTSPQDDPAGGRSRHQGKPARSTRDSG